MHALVKDLFPSLLKSLAQWTELLVGINTSVRANVFVHDIVLHPVHVKGARLGAIDA